MGRIIMTVDPTRSQRGEDVCEFVWLALAAYDKAEVARRAVADWQREDDLSRAVLSAISEIASYVEAFVVESLTTHAELVSADSAEPIPKIVMDAISKPVEGSWVGRRTFIKTWLKEDLSGAGWWKRWMGFVEARNAWAHGQGNLTTRQQGSQETLAQIKAAGLNVSGSQVSGNADDVRRCARSAVEVVDWIDQRVRRV
jgi:hypothetical protein